MLKKTFANPRIKWSRSVATFHCSREFVWDPLDLFFACRKSSNQTNLPSQNNAIHFLNKKRLQSKPSSFIGVCLEYRYLANHLKLEIKKKNKQYFGCWSFAWVFELVCLPVCMYVCMYVYIYIYIYTNIHDIMYTVHVSATSDILKLFSHFGHIKNPTI